MNLAVTSSPGFPAAVYCGGRTKQNGKQSVMEAERFLQPVLHGDPEMQIKFHTVSLSRKLNYPCLLLDWRNALLMLWGEELNGEGGEEGSAYTLWNPPPLPMDTSWVWLGSLPGGQATGLSFLNARQLHDGETRQDFHLKKPKSEGR